MKYLPFFSPPCVGIDIQPHALHVMQIRKKRRGIHIDHADSYPLNGFDWELISSILTDWTRHKNLVGAKAAVSIPASMVRMQRLQLPIGMSNELIEAEINAQVEKDFPGMSAALCVDYSVQPQKQTGYADIIFVIAKQEQVSHYLQCIQSAGLKLKIMDVDIYCLKRVFEQENKIQVLLIFLNKKIILMICHDEILHHSEWDAKEAGLWLAVKNRIQHFFATNSHYFFTQLGIYAHADEISKRALEAKQIVSGEIVILPLPSALMPQENKEDYFFAYGSVMREMPAW